jgi:hypothetical protein
MGGRDKMASSITETVPMAWYLTIRLDSTYSRFTPVGPLVEYLRNVPELLQWGPQQFRNAPGSPSVSLCFARADAAGNYAIGDVLPPTVNVVELVCWDGDEHWYESLAQRVAAYLHWEAVEENSGRTIYPTG